MPRGIAFALVVLLATASVALAGRGDPRDQPDAKDTARARSIILKRADVGAEFRAVAAGPTGDAYCAALDESRLVRTGKAESPIFTRGATLITSRADVYETLTDANRSWRQGVSPAAKQCYKQVVPASGAGPTVTTLSFPRLAAKTFAIRIDGAVTFDLIGLQEGRVQTVTAFVSGAGPLPKADEVALMRVVAARLHQAARG